MPRVKVLISLLFLVFCGCSTVDKNTDTAEGAFNVAAEFDKDERYEEAIRRYQEVKNKFPYSRFATLSELAIADAYFKQESFAEAQVAYQSFKDLHPKHAKIDYVTFQLGMSFFNQLPPTIDRDLTLSSSAIASFDEVISQFSASEFVAPAKEKKTAILKMLAEKEQYIAEFYFKNSQYDSALMRFEGLLQRYSGQGFDANALAKSAISAARLGEKDRARKHLSELQRKFPDSSELEMAKEGTR
jgi:outer membrane protein assembly factor BamD